MSHFHWCYHYYYCCNTHKNGSPSHIFFYFHTSKITFCNHLAHFTQSVCVCLFVPFGSSFSAKTILPSISFGWMSKYFSFFISISRFFAFCWIKKKKFLKVHPLEREFHTHPTNLYHPHTLKRIHSSYVFAMYVQCNLFKIISRTIHNDISRWI